MAHTLFISDLHLAAERPETTRCFFDFLERTAPGADALCILGDLFEYWIGDDDLDDPFNADVAAALRRVTTAGLPVRLMHGNRDFVLGDAFCAATGASPLPDPSTIPLYGTPTLLLHGDTLCTDDVAYQRWRVQSRDPAWQQSQLAQPLAARRALAGRIRAQSIATTANLPANIVDASGDAIEAALLRHACTRMIHGHTHRPARHLHRVDGRTCERWVLPAWDERGGYLRVDADGCTPQRC